MENKAKKKKDVPGANAEFGMEFGDVNTFKVFEHPFPKKKRKKEHKKRPGM
ncbi:hypothetical protein [Bacillus massilinigeriensis]|uniref:hypothetical protein n=1 Tax=Bacillus mediterraneensis TaxID=1805474 RepID=UPI0013564938|nr:hypothetical protein [Bacillus mediterraneensis]